MANNRPERYTNLIHARVPQDGSRTITDYRFWYDDPRRYGLTVDPSGIGVPTPAEIAAGVTPVNYAYAPGVDLRYGVVRDDSTDNQVALTNCIAVGAQGTQIILTPGVACHSGTLDWSHTGLRVYVEGASQLRHTPPPAPAPLSPANVIDGGAYPSATIQNIIIDGYLEELGSDNTNICWDIRAISRSRLDLRGKNCTLIGIRVQWAVLCEFRFVVTGLDVNFTTPPATGILLTERHAGEQCAACLFPLLYVEGLTSGTGLVLASCFACLFDGGSVEGCNIGVDVNSSLNVINTFKNFDLEANIANDVTVSGGSNLKFENCNSISLVTPGPNIALAAGDSTTFIGGYYRWIDCASSATSTGFSFLQISDGVTVGITGTGSKKAIGVVKVNSSLVPTGVFNDDFGEAISFTPAIIGGTTAGTQTYAANGQKGYGRRNGNVFQFSIFLNLASNAGGTGNATITGLPLLSQGNTNGYQTICIGDYTGVTLGAAGRTLAMRINPGVTTGLLLETDTGSVSNFIPIGSISGTAALIISGSYIIG